MKACRARNAGLMVAVAAVATVLSLAPSAAAADPSSTTVQATPSAATTGQLVTLDATVTCSSDPSGGLGVSFFDGSDLLATAPVSADGHSSLTTGFTTTGAHEITAAYNGDDSCSASNDTTTVTVSQAPAPPADNPGCLLCGLIDFRPGGVHNEINVNSHNVTRLDK
ncbi:Ig-like domain-containing protein [Streptomyces zaehneri]|uniref:Ig-like domain-containing protein n=1 Tax=Streptomyces zaehneri TaxID=3051180 RepID=UPI0028D688D3|nr:Ig-like domain-containing protein [Streptomyces sp. DSM 40713]